MSQQPTWPMPSQDEREARMYYLENGADATLKKYPQFKELIDYWEAGEPEKIVREINEMLKKMPK